MKLKDIIIVGYSGHAYVVCDIFESTHQKVIGYCENEAKALNPYDFKYFGQETSELGLQNIRNNDYFIGIGSNSIRTKIQNNLQDTYNLYPINAIHSSAIISKTVILGNGIMVSANVTINALTQIKDGVICNTGCIIEHECLIGKYAHIGPGAVLAGNVSIGEQTFVGANSVIKECVKVGKNVTIGAGTVVIRDIPDNTTVVGNPQRIIK